MADLPGVGSNLKDHLMMNVGFAFPSVTDPMFKLSDLVRTYQGNEKKLGATKIYFLAYLFLRFDC